MFYRFEYSPSNRAACRGACKGEKIMKGELRLGTCEWLGVKQVAAESLGSRGAALVW